MRDGTWSILAPGAMLILAVCLALSRTVAQSLFAAPPIIPISDVFEPDLLRRLRAERPNPKTQSPRRFPCGAIDDRAVFSLGCFCEPREGSAST